MPENKKSFTQGLISSITGRSTPQGDLVSSQAGRLQDFLNNASGALAEAPQDVQWLLGILSAIMESASEGIILTDAQGKILAVNRAFTQVTGYSAQDAIGQNPSLLQSGRHGRDFYTRMWFDLLQKGTWEGEIWNKRKDGEVYAQWLSIRAIPPGEGIPPTYVGVFSDISKRKEIEEKVVYLKTHDSLTGLLNRQYFLERMKTILQPGDFLHSGSFAVLLVQLNSFNQIIEQHGHRISDQLIRAVAMRMKFNLRPDDLAARWAVDQFAVLVHEVPDPQAAETVLRRVIEKLASSFDIKGANIDLSCTGGYSLFPQDGNTPDELIIRATQRLNQPR